jgi:hypothetical protein
MAVLASFEPFPQTLSLPPPAQSFDRTIFSKIVAQGLDIVMGTDTPIQWRENSLILLGNQELSVSNCVTIFHYFLLLPLIVGIVESDRVHTADTINDASCMLSDNGQKRRGFFADPRGDGC